MMNGDGSRNEQERERERNRMATYYSRTAKEIGR